jgi:hypothetical protein
MEKVASTRKHAPTRLHWHLGETRAVSHTAHGSTPGRASPRRPVWSPRTPAAVGAGASSLFLSLFYVPLVTLPAESRLVTLAPTGRRPESGRTASVFQEKSSPFHSLAQANYRAPRCSYFPGELLSFLNPYIGWNSRFAYASLETTGRFLWFAIDVIFFREVPNVLSMFLFFGQVGVARFQRQFDVNYATMRRVFRVHYRAAVVQFRGLWARPSLVKGAQIRLQV